MEQAARRDLASVLTELKTIPFKNRLPLGGRVSTILGFAPDGGLLLLDSKAATAGIIYPYPPSFRPVNFPSLDGTPLVGRIGLHRDGQPRPGLVLCHGVFGSKNESYILRLALRAFYKWGYNVLGIDLRGFGRSANFSDALPTGGWKEGEDLIAAARFLGSFQEVTTVGVSGYSLGAGSTLDAVGMDGGEFITGGAIAWSGFADTRRMLEHISRIPLPWDPYMTAWPLFRICLTLKTRDFGLHQVKSFPDVIRVAAERYGVSKDEVYRRSSPMNHLADIRTPTLHIHAADDPVVPVLEAEDNIVHGAGNPDFEVWIVPKGGHITFSAVDPRWYYGVLRTFFDAWAERP